MTVITYELLHYRYTYHADSGEFYINNVQKHGRKKKGDKVEGTLRRGGYLALAVSVDGKRHYVSMHRAAWIMHYNEIPNVIDHINGIVTDNRICNLRNGDRYANMQNYVYSRKTHTLPQGVTLKRFKSGNTRYTASISVNAKKKHLGNYKTIEEAEEAYKKAKAKYHPNWRGLHP